MLLDPKWEKKLDEIVKPAVPAEPWRKVLRDAADILERDGWIRGSYHRPGLGYCAAGAMHAAIGLEPGSISDNPHFKFAASKLARFVGRSIAGWNDHDAKNGADVIKFLRACADAP